MLTKLHYTLISIIIVLLVGIIAIATPVPPNGHPSSQISFGNDGSLELYSENDPTSYIDFHGTDNLDSDHIGRILSDDNNGFQFFTDISEIRMVIMKDGKVGIGTTQPLSLLNVQAPGEITTGTQKHWIFTAGGKFGDNSANSLVGIKIGGWPGEYNDVPLANRAVGVAAVAESNWANDVGMGLYTGGDQLGEYSEKVRITHDGNVGIGIASPTASLHIKSDAPIFKMTQDTTTWWTRTNNNAQQYAIGFSDDLSDSNIKFSVDTAGSVNLGNNLNMGGLTGALHVQKDPGNLNNADNILHINPFGAHPQVIINANAAKPVTIVGPLTVSDTITVQGHCFRPRTLTRCYKSPDHMTYVDNAGECTAAGFGVEGTVVILAQC
tara:strand:+ start:2716 stop:3858 length:1143 start_codon:yes stop_codon:yes gene_type:complete